MKLANDSLTPKDTILEQMHEVRPLPMGASAFEEWSDRIISGALLPKTEEDPETLIKSQKVALAQMIMHLGPTESHKPDAYFIHMLRKAAVNQVAYAIISKAQQDKKEAEEAAAKKALDEDVQE